MVHPFLYPACAWAAGIWVCSKTGLAAGPALVIAGACLAAAWLSFFISPGRHVAAYLLLASFFLGAGALAVQTRRYEANAAHRLRPDDYGQLIGRMYKSPSRGIDRDYLFLRLEEREDSGRVETRRGNIRVTLPRSQDYPLKLRLLAGDRVRLAARVVKPVEYRNFGPSQSATYLRGQNIHGLAFTKSALLVEKLEPGSGFSLRRAASAARQSFQDRLQERFPGGPSGSLSQEGAILEALLLGERRRMSGEVTLAFQESGLLHLIAISGAHIGMISMLLLGMLRLMGLSPRPSALILIIILLFYSILVEGSPSVLRSTIIAVAFLGGRLLWRESPILNSLAYSALFLLLLNPFSLFDPGFELTYAATLAIVLFQPLILKRLPALPLRLSQAFALSLAAQLGVMPIIAANFNRVTTAPLILNLPAVPLVAVIMAGGYVLFPLASVAPFLAGPLCGLLRVLLSLLLALSRLSGASRLLSFRVPNPSPLTILAYYACLLGLLLPGRRRGLRAALILALALATIFIGVHPFSPAADNLTLTVLDVGQGDSILVEFPGRARMLVDAGGSATGSFDPGERVVSPFLWRKGISKLNLIVSTHDHPDHLQGLAAIARNFRPAEAWEAAGDAENIGRLKLNDALPAGTVRWTVGRGYSRTVSGVSVDVLHPGQGAAASEAEANERSLVLRISFGRTAFLLLGDAGAKAEADLLRSGADLGGGVLKAGHHGSDTSSGPEFLKQAAPRLVIISVGGGNPYGLPREETLKRFHRAGIVVLRTDRDGAVEVTSNGRSYAIRTASRPDSIRILR